MAHGQIYVPPTSAVAGTGGQVTITRGLLDSAKKESCVGFHPKVTATCVPDPGPDTTRVAVPSGAARYNPVYYFVVGLPSLVLGNRHLVLAMRLVSAALSAWMLTWALTSAGLTRHPRVSIAALLFGLTPMAVFMAASVNPNGLEVTAAAAAWVNALLLARRAGPPELRRLLVRRAAIAASVVLLMRSLSPLWIAIIVLVVLASVVGASARNLFRRDVVPWFALVIGVGVLALVWIVVAKSLQISQLEEPVHWSFGRRWSLVWQYLPTRLDQELGVFGWGDTPLPRVYYPVWGVLCAVGFAAALVLVRWRDRIALVLVAAAAIFVPLLIEAAEFNSDGLVWQGRYSLPVSVGVAATAAIALGESRWVRPSVDWLMSLVFSTAATVVWIVGFGWALHRYINGLGEPFSLNGPWQPPIGGHPLIAAQIAVVVVGVGLLLARPERLAPSLRRSSTRRRAPGPSRRRWPRVRCRRWPGAGLATGSRKRTSAVDGHLDHLRAGHVQGVDHVGQGFACSWTAIRFPATSSFPMR